VLRWPGRCQLAHAFRWEYSYKRLRLAQLLGRHGVLLTCTRPRIWLAEASVVESLAVTAQGGPKTTEKGG
jgi:hypothetical protein